MVELSSRPCCITDESDNESLFNYDKVEEQKPGEKSKAYYNFSSYYHGNPNDWLISRKLKNESQKKDDGKVPIETPSKVSSKTTRRRRDSNQTAPTVSLSLSTTEDDEESACYVPASIRKAERQTRRSAQVTRDATEESDLKARLAALRG